MKRTVQIILISIILVLIGTAIYAGSKEKNVNTPSNLNQNLANKSQILAEKETDNIRGNKAAPITLIEYSDYQCPYCVKYHASIKELIEKDSIEVKWIYRHYPLPFHQNAKKAAYAVEAAGKQGKFWEYADKLAEISQADGTGIKNDDLERYATELGLNIDQFKADMNSAMIVQKIDDNVKEAQDLGIEGTPASYLIDQNGQIEDLSGYYTYDELKAKINDIKNK